MLSSCLLRGQERHVNHGASAGEVGADVLAVSPGSRLWSPASPLNLTSIWCSLCCTSTMPQSPVYFFPRQTSSPPPRRSLKFTFWTKATSRDAAVKSGRKCLFFALSFTKSPCWLTYVFAFLAHIFRNALPHIEICVGKGTCVFFFFLNRLVGNDLVLLCFSCFQCFWNKRLFPGFPCRSLWISCWKVLNVLSINIYQYHNSMLKVI